jgi:hypothetical protein
MNLRETEAWLKNVPVIGQPSDSQAEALQGLYGSTGLTTLLGLLLGARQAQYAMLVNLPVGAPEMDCALAVRQGTIKGLELVFDTVREMAVSSDEDGERIEV